MVRVPEPALPGFTANEAPLLIGFADKATSACATGEDVIRSGESFLKSDDGVNASFQCSFSFI